MIVLGRSDRAHTQAVRPIAGHRQGNAEEYLVARRWSAGVLTRPVPRVIGAGRYGQPSLAVVGACQFGTGFECELDLPNPSPCVKLFGQGREQQVADPSTGFMQSQLVSCFGEPHTIDMTVDVLDLLFRKFAGKACMNRLWHLPKADCS